jgi:hypothetical protein
MQRPDIEWEIDRDTGGIQMKIPHGVQLKIIDGDFVIIARGQSADELVATITKLLSQVRGLPMKKPVVPADKRRRKWLTGPEPQPLCERAAWREARKASFSGATTPAQLRKERYAARIAWEVYGFFDGTPPDLVVRGQSFAMLRAFVQWYGTSRREEANHGRIQQHDRIARSDVPGLGGVPSHVSGRHGACRGSGGVPRRPRSGASKKAR